jgi:hypothetical protein
VFSVGRRVIHWRAAERDDGAAKDGSAHRRTKLVLSGAVCHDDLQFSARIIAGFDPERQTNFPANCSSVCRQLRTGYWRDDPHDATEAILSGPNSCGFPRSSDGTGIADYFSAQRAERWRACIRRR